MLEKRILDFALSRLKHGGITISYWDGTKKKYGPEKPYLDILIKDSSAAAKMRKNPTLAFGEAYTDGKIDIKGDLANLLRLVSDNKELLKTISGGRGIKIKRRADARSQKNYVQHHYDLGNEFYKLWLDESMTYSCAYFKNKSDSLEKAQSQKIEHLLKKLQLKRGQTLLDIGCGWGELILRAAKEYDVKVTGITLSKNQHAAVKKKISQLGDPEQRRRISVELADYRTLAAEDKKFDRIISVGMFEHVGRANHREYFSAVNKMLFDGGISVLHTISNKMEGESDAWIDKYIFPGGYIPSWREVIYLLPEYDFRMLDYESLRMHYAMTLDEWSRRFEKNSQIVRKMYDERFVRMWRLYLRSSSGSFRYGDLDLSQIVFTKGINNNLPLTREFLYS